MIDEIYALGVFGESWFVSAAELRPTLGDLVHIVWAFSKDFGASGLRCGVLITENEEVFQAVESQAYWAVCSGDTQHMLGELIAADSWADQYIKEMQAILGDAYARVTVELSTAGIRFIPGEAGFFFLCDMREYMDEPTWEAEEPLWLAHPRGSQRQHHPGVGRAQRRARLHAALFRQRSNRHRGCRGASDGRGAEVRALRAAPGGGPYSVYFFGRDHISGASPSCSIIAA